MRFQKGSKIALLKGIKEFSKGPSMKIIAI